MKEKDEGVIATKCDRMRKIRNRINYYGKTVYVGAVKEHINEIKAMINTLKEF